MLDVADAGIEIPSLPRIILARRTATPTVYILNFVPQAE
jgi:hypothetical protein